MASNFRSLGVDLDSIFAARVNAAGANVGYRVAGNDLATLYEPISSANYTLSATPPNTTFIGQRILSNTLYQAASVDLLNKFCGSPSLYSTSVPTMSPGIVARTAAWTGTVTFRFTVTWASASAFVQFWNTGGRILISASRTGGTANAGNVAITNLLNSIGQVVTADTATFITGAGVNVVGINARYGGTNCPGSVSNLASVNGQSSPYAGDLCTITGSTLTSQRVLAFVINLTQSDSGIILDPISGTLTPTVQVRGYAGQALPTFSVTQNF